MPVKWKIALYGSQRKKLEAQKLHYSVQEFGRQSELIDLETMWNDLVTFNAEKDCVYLDGPIRCTLLTMKNRPNWIPGSWHDPELFRCMSYYAHWGKYITQQEYAFMPLGEIYRRRDWLYEQFGKDGMIFLRPDYGEKIFTGQLVATEHFKDFYIHESLDTVDPKTICIVARPKKILKEYRLVMLNGKVHAGSLYGLNRSFLTEPLSEQSDAQAIIEYAEMVANDNPPKLPRCYVLDIAKEEVGYSVLEIGCVAAAGFYAADLVKVAEAISLAAEQDWEEFHAE